MPRKILLDNGGIAINNCEFVKLQSNSSTWATRIQALCKREDRIIRIMTYSLPNIRYVASQINRRPYSFYLIAHSKFINEAKKIKDNFPLVRIALNDKVHSKVLLASPNVVIVSSANFGRSKWHESSITIHSKEAHNWYVDEAFNPIWAESTEI